MISTENIINLEDFRAKDPTKKLIAKVFTGRDRGKIVREQSNLDVIEAKYETVNIVIPENIYSINPSFFEELFVNVVRKLGKDGFLSKFKFTYQGYNFEEKLIEAIERILRDNTALDK